jgi:hypothetical protein
MGLSTLLGFKPRGFYIPYRYADSVPVQETYRILEQEFERLESKFSDFIDHINKYSSDLIAIGPDNPPQPRWNQTWFPTLDAAAAYTMVREKRPARIIEVGSGHSTRFMARAVNDGNLNTRITAIDPSPRATISSLNINIINTTVQEVDRTIFDSLSSGDFLFIDSSHILMPGTDVDFLLNQILPSLPADIFIHIHDIFLPGAYPISWRWRGYNEQQAVAVLLQGGAYQIIFPSHYVATRMTEIVNGSVLGQLESMEGAIESGLWLQKTGNEIQ